MSIQWHIAFTRLLLTFENVSRLFQVRHVIQPDISIFLSNSLVRFVPFWLWMSRSIPKSLLLGRTSPTGQYLVHGVGSRIGFYQLGLSGPSVSLCASSLLAMFVLPHQERPCLHFWISKEMEKSKETRRVVGGSPLGGPLGGSSGRGHKLGHMTSWRFHYWTPFVVLLVAGMCVRVCIASCVQLETNFWGCFLHGS